MTHPTLLCCTYCSCYVSIIVNLLRLLYATIMNARAYWITLGSFHYLVMLSKWGWSKNYGLLKLKSKKFCTPCKTTFWCKKWCFVCCFCSNLGGGRWVRINLIFVRIWKKAPLVMNVVHTMLIDWVVPVYGKKFVKQCISPKVTEQQLRHFTFKMYNFLDKTVSCSILQW